jgi:hypothetical protein
MLEAEKTQEELHKQLYAGVAGALLRYVEAGGIRDDDSVFLFSWLHERLDDPAALRH